MNATAAHRSKHLLALVVGAALAAACADQTPVAPDRAAPQARPALAVGAAGPELGSCSKLSAPEGSTFAFHAYARGAQLYRWSGSAWAPAGVSAELFADEGGKGLVGIHYTGPYWESLGGSRVKGALVDRCPVGGNAIDWLALAGTPEGGPGVFQQVTFIQRVNTVGGRAPSSGGTLDEVVEVPYTAEYYFYRAP
jgi:hypothetical protein